MLVFSLHLSAHTSTVERVPLERHLGKTCFNAGSGYLSELIPSQKCQSIKIPHMLLQQERKKVKCDISNVGQLTKLEDT